MTTRLPQAVAPSAARGASGGRARAPPSLTPPRFLSHPVADRIRHALIAGLETLLEGESCPIEMPPDAEPRDIERGLARRHEYVPGANQVFRTAYRELFLDRVEILWNADAKGDKVGDFMTRAIPPGMASRIMGSQNIKGTGLDFVYRWLAIDRVRLSLEKMQKNPASRREILTWLSSYTDFGLSGCREALAALKVVRDGNDAAWAEPKNLVDSAIKRLETLDREKTAALDAVAKAGAARKILGKLEQLADPLDSIRRTNRAKVVMGDLYAQRIGHGRAAMIFASRRRLGIPLAGALLAGSSPAAALDLPETSIAYRIEAELDPATRVLKGTEEIRWTNRTDTTLTALPLHLYLNGFAHDQTTWMQSVSPERLQLGELLAREPDPWGYMEPLSIRVRTRADGPEQDASWRPVQPDDGNALDRSLGEVSLPAPLPPGGQIVLNIAFEGRLPVPIARTGGTRDFYLVAQWYPKIGVIEPTGVRHAPKPRSAARQFHGPTEFYADFADYEVTFKVPSGWLVGATGRAAEAPVEDGSGRTAARYKQRAVHDFALVAGKTLKDEVSRYLPKGGGPAVDVRYIVTAGSEHQIPRWKRAIEGGLDVLGSRVGPYPYDTLTVVMMPFWAIRTAGMEYPTFITGVPPDPFLDMRLVSGLHLAEATVIHELGHQYFYGLLASNEQEEAFLDEGFNSYWENEIMQTLFGKEASQGRMLGRTLEGIEARSNGLDAISAEIREPVRKIPSWLFAAGTTGSQIYGRSAVTFVTAARLFGQEKVDRTFAEYFRRFAFRHPDADDFLTVAAEAGGSDLDAFCREAFERERIPNFAVTEVRANAWKPPLGRVMTEAGPVMLTRRNEAQHAETGLPPEARESDGRVLVEIVDPGWARAGQSQLGSVTRTLVTPERKEPTSPGGPDGYYESKVRLAGPGWSTLPVDVELRFADGAVVRDAWDGKAAWRSYRFVRRSPIVDARVDPAGRIAVDVRPQDDALSASADTGFAADWGLWLGAATAWLAGGLAQWL